MLSGFIHVATVQARLEKDLGLFEKYVHIVESFISLRNKLRLIRVVMVTAVTLLL